MIVTNLMYTPRAIHSIEFTNLPFRFYLSNAAMQCIGQTYSINLGMVFDGVSDGDVRQCVGTGKFTKFSNGCIFKSCSPIEMKF